MADGGVTAALIIGGISAATSAGIAYDSAQRQNRATRKAVNLQQQAAIRQKRQVNDAAALEMEKRRAEAARIRALLRVTSGDEGEGGSFDALIRQADYDESLNKSIIETNRRNQISAVASGAEANILNLSSRMSNALLDSLTAGIGGFSTGLQIGGAVNELRDPRGGRRLDAGGVEYSGFGEVGGGYA